jgi:hypothetical protein
MTLNILDSRKCVVVAPKCIRSNSEYSMSVATHGATEPMKFRVKLHERENPASNKTLDYKPRNDKAKHDPHDCVSSVGPKKKKKSKKDDEKCSSKKDDDKCSKDDKKKVTFVNTQTKTVNPNSPEMVKFKVFVIFYFSFSI